MPHAHSSNDDSPISEMSIVDTFTKLIFGEEGGYSRRELSIIQALRMVEVSVLADSHRDMGAYLRTMEVREMIELVARVRRQLDNAPASLPVAAAMSPPLPGELNRRL